MERERIDLLIETLLDPTAPWADRDDAAIDLAEVDAPKALDALVSMAVQTELPGYFLESCGEAIAEMWIRLGILDVQTFALLAESARTQVRAIIAAKRPEWLPLLGTA